MLNIEWFNPYEETPYSAGVIYFVVQNLPRSERFKFENVILVGIILGPKEHKRRINSFQSPIVDDLQNLHTGIIIYNPNSFCKTTVLRAVLSCVSCDFPATRIVDFVLFPPFTVVQNAWKNFQLVHSAVSQIILVSILSPGVSVI